MNEPNPKFQDIGKQSFKSTNRQLAVLLETLFFLFVRWVPYMLVSVVIFYIAAFQHPPLATVLYAIGLVYTLFALAKINASLGLAFTLIAIGDAKPTIIASRSMRRAMRFFMHGWATGIFLFFGQLILFCPCFLLLDNFIFSPFLFVYEDIYGNPARARSVAISKGREWMVLSWTITLLTGSYLFLILVLFLLFTTHLYIGISVLVLGLLYNGLFQANFVHHFYDHITQTQSEGLELKIGQKYKVYALFGAILLICAYVIIKLFPYILLNVQSIWNHLQIMK